jgi:hypothetical protein
MMRFSSIQLHGDRLKVVGPFTPVDGAQVQLIDFTVAQPGVAVQGQGTMEATGDWSGEAAAGGMQLGPAFAFGTVHMTTPVTPPGFQTFTWFEQVDVTL